MKKCREKILKATLDQKPPSTIMASGGGGSLNNNRPRLAKRAPSFVISGGRRGRHVLSVEFLLLLGLSVIATHFVGAVTAQLAQPIQQIPSSASSESLHPINDHASLTARHGGNLYAPQHGYDNNIEFIHEQTESIYEVPSPHLEDNSNDPPPANGHEDPPNDHHQPESGAGDIYLNNGAPELETDSDLLHRHHLDESLNENQLPGDEEDGARNSEFTELDGGIIVGQKILRQSESPYVLNTDLEVEKGGTLTIEPGVTIEFAPMVGITVRGVINAVVSLI